jgi:hypothetical protein
MPLRKQVRALQRVRVFIEPAFLPGARGSGGDGQFGSFKDFAPQLTSLSR